MIYQYFSKLKFRLRKTLSSTRTFLRSTGRALQNCWKALLFSSGSALLLIILSYLLDSVPYPIGGEVNVNQWLERFREIIYSDTNNIPDSICLINVAYDKVLVDYDAPLYSNDINSPRLPAGKITTTDRKKLYDFLTLTKSINSYRYIILDIRFEDDIENDSITECLLELIGNMRNIAFARHENSPLTENAPINKAALADYHTTFLVNDIVKYPLLKKTNDEPYILNSIPAKMYSDLYGGKFSTWGPLTFYNGHLCTRSIYPSFPVRISSWAVESKDTNLPVIQYHNLGEDILNTPNSKDVVQSMVENRIVVVGDLIDDTHNTYIGYQPGAIVNLNAYISLCRKEHLISWGGLIFQFLLYFIITWIIIRRLHLINKIKCLDFKTNRITRFIFSLFGFSAILILTSAFAYMIFGIIFSIALPIIYFTILESCTKLRY